MPRRIQFWLKPNSDYAYFDLQTQTQCAPLVHSTHKQTSNFIVEMLLPCFLWIPCRQLTKSMGHATEPNNLTQRSRQKLAEVFELTSLSTVPLGITVLQTYFLHLDSVQAIIFYRVIAPPLKVFLHQTQKLRHEAGNKLLCSKVMVFVVFAFLVASIFKRGP